MSQGTRVWGGGFFTLDDSSPKATVPLLQGPSLPNAPNVLPSRLHRNRLSAAKRTSDRSRKSSPEAQKAQARNALFVAQDRIASIRQRSPSERP